MIFNNLTRPFTLINSINSSFYQLLRVLSMDSEMASANWRGVPLSEIIGSQSPWGAPEFPLVTPSHNHTVLYHIPANGDNGDGPLKPQRGQDKWDNDHVRMPCSNKSLYPFENSDSDTQLRKRWEMIVEALRKPILNSQQLADTILSYNTKFKTVWKFTAMHALFNDHLEEEIADYFFQVTLPQIAELALELPKLIQAPIPLLKQHKNHSISLTQQQIASLLANAFFCTFPRRNTTKRNSEYSTYPHINFTTLYESCNENSLEKLTCFCHYFRRVCTKAPVGVVSFSRRSVPPRRLPAWADSARTVAALPVHVQTHGNIEDAHGLMQMDFANKYLGGGVLGHGCVQEEIRFCICPELIASMLFTEVMRPNEALLVIGCERYSQYTGYGRTFRWAGDYSDVTPRDSAARRRVAVLAIDALPYAAPRHEYSSVCVTRELNKAWVGVSFHTSNGSVNYPGLATGNWGCGAFGGTPGLKALIQMMAAAEARRPMAYFTFGDVEIRDDIINMYNLLAKHNVTVGQLYNYIVRFSKTDLKRTHLHAYIQQLLNDEENERIHKTEQMDISISPKIVKKTESLQNVPGNISPDLFSPDENCSQKSKSETNKVERPSKSGSTTPIDTFMTVRQRDYKRTSLSKKMAPQTNKMAPQTNNMAPQTNNMAPQTNNTAQTKRLFDELQKFDDDNGKLNLTAVNQNNDVTSRYFGSQKSEDIFKSSESDLPNNDVQPSPQDEASENKMEESENNIAGTSRLFEEMQRFDDEHGKLNLSVPCSPLFPKHTIQDSDVSMESDRSEAPSSETKKKITKKITDYFSKKTT